MLALLLLQVRTSLLFVKITQEIQAAAEAGMQEKAKEFREQGSEIYLVEIPRS